MNKYIKPQKTSSPDTISRGDLPESIVSHYGSSNLESKIYDGLAKAGKDTDNLAIKDLSVIDQLHTGGHIATLELAHKAAIKAGYHLFDAGCGIGGSSRLLAEKFQCRVTGMDLVPSFVQVSEKLSISTHTEDSVNFVCGNIIDTELKSEIFDMVWCQHTLMNIENKRKVFEEFMRILKPGGTVVLHEILKGDDNMQEGIALPVPWAAAPEHSFLITIDVIKSIINDCGFKVRFLNDVTEQAKVWWEKVDAAFSKTEGSPPKPLGPHIIFGENGKLFGKTMTRNLNEGRIRMIEAALIRIES
ncbi:putative Methyltransferase type 11 [Desulfamplus magnetovallimortis]|uniref:Putative Methyltransferase type 11 n=1 Tax=Desulfamplus magnetovallimortis TaxID=1246637 RepID=A0A1W1HHX4_9BACT|nr:class I SAM-dependent methyltransferase [Desulfamplus magnetovallimortis]SLM32046.1 putative Methyltransferase type 11 [Desulfamplus magnetovallimortis]